MTVPELQELLRCSRAMAYGTAQAIGVIHVGRAVRIPSSALRRWLRDQEEGT